MKDGLEELDEEFDPGGILQVFEDAKRSGGVDAEEGIRIFEARADAIIAAQRAIEAKQERVDKSV